MTNNTSGPGDKLPIILFPPAHDQPKKSRNWLAYIIIAVTLLMLLAFLRLGVFNYILNRNLPNPQAASLGSEPPVPDGLFSMDSTKVQAPAESSKTEVFSVQVQTVSPVPSKTVAVKAPPKKAVDSLQKPPLPKRVAAPELQPLPAATLNALPAPVSRETVRPNPDKRP